MSVYSFSNKCLGKLIDKEVQLYTRYTSKQASIISYNSDNKGTCEVPCVKRRGEVPNSAFNIHGF